MRYPDPLFGLVLLLIVAVAFVAITVGVGRRMKRFKRRK
jgi:hypothetical protein